MRNRLLALALLALACGSARAQGVTEAQLKNSARTYQARQRFAIVGITTCAADPPVAACVYDAGIYDLCIDDTNKRLYACVAGTWTAIGNADAAMTVALPEGGKAWFNDPTRTVSLYYDDPDDGGGLPGVVTLDNRGYMLQWNGTDLYTNVGDGSLLLGSTVDLDKTGVTWAAISPNTTQVLRPDDALQVKSSDDSVAASGLPLFSVLWDSNDSRDLLSVQSGEVTPVEQFRVTNGGVATLKKATGAVTPWTLTTPTTGNPAWALDVTNVFSSAVDETVFRVKQGSDVLLKVGNKQMTFATDATPGALVPFTFTANGTGQAAFGGSEPYLLGVAAKNDVGGSEYSVSLGGNFVELPSNNGVPAYAGVKVWLNTAAGCGRLVASDASGTFCLNSGVACPPECL